MWRGLATSTVKSYQSAQRSFLKFCNQLDITPLPAQEWTLIIYAAHLAQTVSVSTIKMHMAAIRHLHIIQGLDPPPTTSPRIHLVINGIQRVRPRVSQSRLPVTPTILRRVKAVLDQDPLGFNNRLLWAACCTAFFGFMRSGEFTVPSSSLYNPDHHLSMRDVAIDNHCCPSLVAVTLRVSKTSQFSPVTIFLKRTQADLCPVKALLSYLEIRGTNPGPLFVTEDRLPLAKPTFLKMLHSTLSKAGIDPSQFKGHSFRIGAATTAAAAGVHSSIIKSLGRWASSAFEQYIRIPRSDMMDIPRLMLQEVASSEN